MRGEKRPEVAFSSQPGGVNVFCRGQFWVVGDAGDARQTVAASFASRSCMVVNTASVENQWITMALT